MYVFNNSVVESVLDSNFIIGKGPFTNYVMLLRWVDGQQHITIANFIK